MWDSEHTWDKFTSDPGYSLGDYNRASLAEVYGLADSHAPAELGVPVATTPLDKLIEGIMSLSLPKLVVGLKTKLFELEAQAKRFVDHDAWLEECIINAGENEDMQSACMS